MTSILLVEDNPLNRDMLSRRLLRKRFAVTTAADGETGYQMIVEQQPDIVLLDMNLPLLDGWGVARKLRAEQPQSRSKIIALTAHALDGDRERALEAGCDDYETKPVDFQRLLDAIARNLQTA